MVKWHYRYAGLLVTSDLELPEWKPFSSAGGRDVPDVTVRLEAARAYDVSLADAEMPASVDEYRFNAPDVGIYRIFKGHEIEVTPVPGAGLNELRLFLLGSAWGILCYQRGMFAVHASAVQVGSEAVLFCGLQGKGKSTMTAWLANRGYGLVSDDLCSVHFASGVKPMVYPSTQKLRLWQDALAALGWDSNTLERDHFRIDKYLLPWQEKTTGSPLPIRAIYLLEWGELRLQHLTGMGALQRFIAAATYRGEALSQMGLTASYWHSCLQLLQQVPVWELQRQKEFSMLDAVGTLLETQWGHH